mmetsp:Transcript_14873/g.31808  ORF Transcript_14873/g.31808 Transcript_14873/m.31808 type:complete len:215 (-) Transcript_14873:1203-1847(-)
MTRTISSVLFVRSWSLLVVSCNRRCFRSSLRSVLILRANPPYLFKHVAFCSSRDFWGTTGSGSSVLTQVVAAVLLLVGWAVGGGAASCFFLAFFLGAFAASPFFQAGSLLFLRGTTSALAFFLEVFWPLDFFLEAFCCCNFVFKASGGAFSNAFCKGGSVSAIDVFVTSVSSVDTGTNSACCCCKLNSDPVLSPINALVVPAVNFDVAAAFDFA